jgi:hypothetical protein
MKWRRLLIFLAFALQVPATFAALPTLRNNEPISDRPFQDQCNAILAFQNLQLNDLVETGFVVKKDELLYVTPGEVPAHEMRTATLLATRLEQPIALISRAYDMNIPSVDGVLFNSRGYAVSNFSLKSVTAPNSKNMNETVKGALKRAEEVLNDQYTRQGWQSIAEQQLPGRLQAYRHVVGKTLTRIFGLGPKSVRPVSIVIDYSEMEDMGFHLSHQGLDGTRSSRTFISLDKSNDGQVEINTIMQRVRDRPNIKEYIFLGMHHLLRVTADGYSVDEYCDDLGHIHCSHESH